jgi:hypothetical protein
VSTEGVLRAEGFYRWPIARGQLPLWRRIIDHALQRCLILNEKPHPAGKRRTNIPSADSSISGTPTILPRDSNGAKLASSAG